MRLLPLLVLLVSAPAWAAPNLDYDLWANAPLAHLYQGGVVADGAEPGVAKYLRDNLAEWTLGASDEGRPVALPPGRQVRFWLPVGPELAGEALSLELMVRPNGGQRLGVYLNDKALADEKLPGTWQTLRYPVAARSVSEGHAEVRLLFRRTRWLGKVRTPAAVRYVRLVKRGTPALPDDESALAAALAKRSGEALRLSPDGGLDYYITPVKGQTLSLSADGAPVEVSVQLDGAGPAWLAGGKKVSISLDRFAGRAMRLMLRAKGGEALLRGARIAGARAGTPIKPRKPKYVVFWLIDALRADKLPFYDKRGSRRPQVKTPNLSAMAKGGAVFDPFWVTSNESKASHASYWTGTYPAVHRVINHKAKLRSNHLVLAEAFRKAGFATAAFISNGYISNRWNFLQGFQHEVNFIREEKPNGADAVVAEAIPWLRKRKGSPFYLYLGTADPHVTYRAHKEFIDVYDPKPYAGPYRRYLAGTSLERIKTGNRRPSRRNRQRIEALYENEIAWNDKHFGVLVAELKKLGLYKDTLFIINADHGEEFWEHGSCGHGHSLHQEMVSVPFVLHWPGVIPAGARVTSGHDGVDLLPTVQALLGQSPADEVQGESLLPFISARGAYPRAMIATKELTMYTLRVGPAKVILRGSDSLRVYDMDKDPAEQKNLFGRSLVLTHAALDPLSLYIPRAKTWKKTRWGSPNNLTRQFDK